MANYSNMDIYNALKMLQNICREHPNCESCPFTLLNTDFCGIQQTAPHDYELVSPDEYKPFRQGV